jgi:cytoskeleton protein RodZ
MESIGEKLRGAREEKGYSIDQVARDTNIARRFIEALEHEEFSVFPGDTYVLGFLRNYSDYLGLDPDRVIILYKNLKIQEQPVPVEDLIKRKRKVPFGLIAVVLLAAAVLAGGGYGIYYFLQQRTLSPKEETVEKSEAEREPDYVLQEEIVERRFEEGQLIRIRLGETAADLSIAAVKETVRIAYGQESEELLLGRERVLDLDGDGNDDIKLSVRDIDASAAAAVLRFDRSLYEAGGASAEQQDGELDGETPSVGSTNLEARREKARTIIIEDSPEPFRVSIDFRGYCLIRYEKDGSIREERYFRKGETFRLDVNVKLMIWVSNAGAFTARIAGEEVSLGGPGEVSVKLIRWEKEEESGRNRLIMLPVY